MKLITDFRNNLNSTQLCMCDNSYKYKNRIIGGLLFNFRSGSNTRRMDYVIYTPCGANYTACPVCGCSANFYDDNDDNYSKWDKLTDVDNDTDIGEWDYCSKCKIVFDKELHAVNGCTSNVYTAIFISKFKWKGEIYNGMPCLSIDEFFEACQTPNILNILDTVSTNTLPVPLRYCSRAYYPYDKNNNKFYYD